MRTADGISQPPTVLSQAGGDENGDGDDGHFERHGSIVYAWIGEACDSPDECGGQWSEL
jgi:hypothetical protein